MKKPLFILILFLAFFLQFSLAKAGHFCDLSNTVASCEDGYSTVPMEETAQTSPETVPPAAVGEAASQSVDVVKTFTTLVFQFFGIVILFIFLTILLQEITNSE